MNEQYTDKLVTLYLREIIKISDEIKNKTNKEEDLKILEQILSLDMDKLKTLEETIKYLSDKILELHKLNYDINKEQEEIAQINDYKIGL